MAGLTSDEHELYDRQIRLWGLETQQKLQQTRLKVINCDALGCEIAKNAVLSGVNVCLVDESQVTDEDVACNFFYSSVDVGHNKAQVTRLKMQDMNSCVEVTADPAADCQVVVVSGGPQIQAVKLNENARNKGAMFYWVVLRGTQGCAFKDAGDAYTYKIKADSSDITKRGKMLSEVCPMLPGLVSAQTRVKGIEALLSVSSLESCPVFYPTVSILGGQIMQDIIRSLAHRGDILADVLVVDTASGSACTFEI